MSRAAPVDTAPYAPAEDWLTIHEASALVGVSVATLRRWCDAGEVRAFTTPGGHRRFARSAVLALVPAVGHRPHVGHDGETAIRIIRAYRRQIRRAGDGTALPPALEAISERDRDPFREHGRHMVSALVNALDAPSGEAAGHHATARRGAAECGRMAALVGLSLQETMALFVRFRAPFLHELGALARRRGLDAGAATEILERASDAIDRLLPAVITGFDAASA